LPPWGATIGEMRRLSVRLRGIGVVRRGDQGVSVSWPEAGRPREVIGSREECVRSREGGAQESPPDLVRDDDRDDENACAPQ